MRKYTSKKSSRRATVLTIAALLLLLIFSSDISVRPTVKAIAEAQIKRELHIIISDAVKSSVEEYEGELSEIKYSPTGKISSVAINPAAVSGIQSSVTQRVNERLESGNVTVGIPIGTFSGLAFLSGKGRETEFSVISDKSAYAEAQSTFSSAGINQTLHEIRITVRADATAVIPLYNTHFSVEETYIISNTVIVGEIPESYTSVTGDDRNELTKLFDYGN